MNIRFKTPRSGQQDRLCWKFICDIPRLHNRSRHSVDALSPDSLLFQTLKEKIIKSCVKHRQSLSPTCTTWHEPPKIEINKIEKISSPRFIKNFETGVDKIVGKWPNKLPRLPPLLRTFEVAESADEVSGLNEILAFHGTNAETAGKIVCGGLDPQRGMGK
jgi:hypothetical protein